MLTSEILRALPDSVRWMVLFRLSAIRPWAVPQQMQAMFFLPDHLDLTAFSHVILSSAGRYLAPWEGSELYPVNGSELQSGPAPGMTLFDRFSHFWALFSPDDADCLGLGEKPDLPPVLLHLTMENGWGKARAVFQREPSRQHYELLNAVGVRYEGGYAVEDGFVALFRNRLCTHLQAGALANYSRTGNCNELFLNHGEIDEHLEAGLIAAARARTAAGLKKGYLAAAELGAIASRRPLAMTCVPPAPQHPFAYGDLVPLGFLLKALHRIPTAAAPVRDRLLASRQGKLWAFHTGRLVTATDSVLILQGLPERESIMELETFSDGEGGYFPQLWSETEKPGHMLIDEANAHWCQPDFATTCLVRGLRAAAGLPCVTPLRYLEERFATRSGLYFANPYLTDWALAKALETDADASDLKERLIAEILAGMNEDDSFGTFDPALSTSLAVLALAALGCRGRVLCLAQLRLLEMVEDAGMWPQSAPFYSTFRRDDGKTAWHDLSLYIDSYRMIGTSLAIQALEEHCDPYHRDLHLRRRATVHPRYRCRDHAEYIANCALPAYAGQAEKQVVAI